MKINHARGRFDVTSAFGEAHKAFLGVPHASLEAERQRVLNLSNSRRLSDEERERLDAITRVINVHRALDVFDDVSHADFGFEGADQLHGNRVSYDCGCEVHYAFDHHQRHSDQPRSLHPHRSEAHCHTHRHLKGKTAHEHHKALAG